MCSSLITGFVSSMIGVACAQSCSFISKGRKSIHTFIFLVSVFLASLVSAYADKAIPYFEGRFALCDNAEIASECIRSEVFFRIMMAVGAFYFFHILTSCITHALNNLFWMLKIMALLGLMVGSLFIPPNFVYYYFIISCVIALIYLFFQIMIFTNFINYVDLSFEIHSTSSKVFYIFLSGIPFCLALYSFSHNLYYSKCFLQQLVSRSFLPLTIISVFFAIVFINRREDLSLSILSVCGFIFYMSFQSMYVNVATSLNSEGCNQIEYESVIKIFLVSLMFCVLSVLLFNYIYSYETKTEYSNLRTVVSEEDESKTHLVQEKEVSKETGRQRLSNILFFAWIFGICCYISVGPTMFGALINEKIFERLKYGLFFVYISGFVIYPLMILNLDPSINKFE